ncbi:MAG: amidohydrolase family protein [Armatimonadota bacterium]|jgi:predicted TIM-barrel fold metal-dependent hydrolase
MEIFANHAHVFPNDIRPEGSIESLLRLMDECGIARAVCFAPHRRSTIERGYPEPNEWLAGAVAEEPRLVAFACIRPVDEDAIERLDAAVRMGMRGCKIHPASDRFDILDDRAMDFYAAAEELGVVLDFHTGPHWYRIKHYHPLGFDEIAWRHPRLKLVLEHLGGLPFYHDVLGVLGNNLPVGRPGRLFGGISSVLNRDLQRLWYLGIEKVGDAIFRLGEDMPIYGLDFPYNPVELVIDELHQLRTLNLSDEGFGKLFGGNLERAINHIPASNDRTGH